MTWRVPVARGAMLVMEAIWVYAFIALCMAVLGGSEMISVIGAGLIVGASYAISRLLQSSNLDLKLMRIWGIVASLILFYAIVRIDLFHDFRLWDFTWADQFADSIMNTLEGHAGVIFAVPALWYFWMRGVSRGQDPLMFDAVISSFATGVVVIVAVELLANEVDAPAMIRYVAVPYMAAGLVAVSLAHAAKSELEYGRSFSGSWLIAVGGAVLLMSLVALVFVVIDLKTMRDAITFAGTWIGRGGFLIFYGISYVIALGVEAVVNFLWWALGVSTEYQSPDSLDEEPSNRDEGDSFDPGFPAWIWFIGRAIGGLALVAAAAGFLYLTFVKYMKRKAPSAMKESTYSEGRLGTDLGNLLGSMLNKLRPNIHFGGEPDPVRRLYFEMLNEASQRGVERSPSQTPLEMVPALSSPFGRPAPEAITGAFEDVRYGGRSASAEEVRRLRDQWDTAKKHRRPEGTTE